MIITCSPLEQFSIIPSIPKRIHKFGTSRKESILDTTPDYPFQLLWFLRYHTNTRLEISIDIRGVDYPSQEGRFKVVYNLPSIRYNLCIRVQIGIDEITSASSVISIFPSAGRWEREMWDMFGLYFSNYPDLRRILTDYGFEGHSLCKDFPSSGYIEVRYDDLEKRVVSEPIEIPQEFRYFDSASPWKVWRRLLVVMRCCFSLSGGEGSRGEDPKAPSSGEGSSPRKSSKKSPREDELSKSSKKSPREDELSKSSKKEFEDLLVEITKFRKILLNVRKSLHKEDRVTFDSLKRDFDNKIGAAEVLQNVLKNLIQDSKNKHFNFSENLAAIKQLVAKFYSYFY